LRKPAIQVSKLLPYLFEHLNEQQRVTVFHAGPAQPDTVDFFSNYRCQLHFVDIFSELPIVAMEDSGLTLVQQFEKILHFPPQTLFDICLFWDLFNFLDGAAIRAFLQVLRPHLKETSQAHAFTVHNVKTPQGSHLYGIQQSDALSCRSRRTALPGYAPHRQGELKDLLHCFRFERSVLLPDSRLELLLQANLLSA
jgi:hypothetical protein